jgi:hypothetical protein
MPVNVNFIFPDGCSERYREAEMPSVPRIGEHVQGTRPQSGRYRVEAVRYDIDPEAEGVPRCNAVTVVLQALDEVNHEASK